MKPYHEAMREAQRDYLLAAIRQHGTITAAAAASRVNRTHFYELLEQAGIEPPTFGRLWRDAGNAAWDSLKDMSHAATGTGAR
jgi:hypothetical protein